MTRCRVRQESWQRIGGESPPWGKDKPTTPTPSDARRPARADVKRSQGRPRAKYRAAKRVYFRGADLVLLKRRQHLPWRNGLHGQNLAQSETLCTWRSSLHGNWEISSVSGEARRTGS